MNLRSLVSDVLHWNAPALRLRMRLLLMRLKRRWAVYWRSGEFERLDPKDIPVIINSYNTLDYLKRLVEWLERAGCSKIILLDNASTYPPLLEYYKSIRHEVIYLGSNLGHRALWMVPSLAPLLRSYYIYTDPDVVPDPGCPPDVIAFLFRNLHREYSIDKIGLGLRIDDLPDHYARKNEVMDWESRFWQLDACPGCKKAPVDTTFALYAPFAQGGGECKAWRTDAPYLALHLPWYEDSRNLMPERLYYHQHRKPGASHWA